MIGLRGKARQWVPVSKLLDKTISSAHVIVEGSARPVWVRKGDIRAEGGRRLALVPLPAKGAK